MTTAGAQLPKCGRCFGFGFHRLLAINGFPRDENVKCDSCRGTGYEPTPVVVSPLAAVVRLPAVPARIECDRDGCGWYVKVTQDIDERQAAAIVTALGGTTSHGMRDSHHCPQHAVAAPVEQSSTATVIGVAK